jgi:hypothetical protein
MSLTMSAVRGRQTSHEPTASSEFGTSRKFRRASLSSAASAPADLLDVSRSVRAKSGPTIATEELLPLASRCLCLRIGSTPKRACRHWIEIDSWRWACAVSATSLLFDPIKHPTRRTVFARAAAIYQERFADAQGRLPATFQVLFLTAWAPTRRSSSRPSAAAARPASRTCWDAESVLTNLPHRRMIFSAPLSTIDHKCARFGISVDESMDWTMPR